MKKKVACIFSIFILTFFSVQTISAQSSIICPENEKEETENIILYAKSAVLMDADSGRVLYEKNGYEHMPNASTTKILTCILAIESGMLEETVEISSYAASMPKVRLGMTKGDSFSMKDLVYSLMLESHNDSAVAIAEHIGGSVEKFASMMNKKAKEIGCEDTYFITPNGLDGEDENGIHGTSGRDLSLLMSYCIQNETFLEVTRTPSYSFSDVEGKKSYSCQNKNAFLDMMEGALSGKTGFTGNAGYCYVGALRQGERTFVVSLLACGWPNNKSYKWSDTKQLMNYALENYQYEDVFEYDKVLSEIPVTNGVAKSGKLNETVYIQPVLEGESLTILKKESEPIEVVYDIPEKLEAPIEKNAKVGIVSYYLDKNMIGSYNITVKESVDELNFSWYYNYTLKQLLMTKN